MSLSPDDYVLLSNGVKNLLVRVSDIVAIEVSGNYVSTDLIDTRLSSYRGSLHHYEEKLPSTFFRTGRSCLVNLGQVKKVSMANPKQFVLTMKNDKEILVSRKQSICLRQQKLL
jgi:two-component system, LytTR family, response regulator